LKVKGESYYNKTHLLEKQNQIKDDSYYFLLLEPFEVEVDFFDESESLFLAPEVDFDFVSPDIISLLCVEPFVFLSILLIV
jgi:hypothetical protein